MARDSKVKKLPSEYRYHNNITHKIHVLSRLYAKSASLEFRRLYGIARSELLIIHLLGNRGETISRDIAQLSFVDKSMVSRALTGLQKKNLINRFPNTKDHRCEWVALTPKGKSLFKRTTATSENRYHHSLNRLKKSEIKLLDSILDRLYLSAEEMYNAETIHKES